VYFVASFEVLAHTDNTACAAIAHHEKKLYGVQFHPEVVHSLGGLPDSQLVHHICDCEPTWTTAAFVKESIREIEPEGEKRVLLALLGSRFFYTCLLTA